MSNATNIDLTIPASLNRADQLPAMIDRAAKFLSGARTSAEILEAREIAGAVYDMAKRAARFGKAKNAHDDLLAKVHRAQADALEIEARAKRRLADEYDAAQERGEVAKIGDNLPSVPDGNAKPTAADIGISRKDIHEARLIRDAEEASPGVVHEAIAAAIAAGQEPTRAKVRRAVRKAVKREAKPPKKRRKKSKPHPATEESQHDRDLQMLIGVWEAACETARAAFLKIVI